MRPMVLSVLLLSACSINVPPTITHIDPPAPDMVMADVDMAQATTADLSPIILNIPDMAQRPVDMACAADTQNDVNNCGTCGNVCQGSMSSCVRGQCLYKHYDTVCSTTIPILSAQYWFDTNTTVSGSNSDQAQAACRACMSNAELAGYTYLNGCLVPRSYVINNVTYTGYEFAGKKYEYDLVTGVLFFAYSGIAGTGWSEMYDSAHGLTYLSYKDRWDQ